MGKNLRKLLNNSFLNFIKSETDGEAAYVIDFMTEKSEEDNEYHVRVIFDKNTKNFAYEIVYSDGETFTDKNYFNSYWRGKIEDYVLSMAYPNDTTVLLKENVTFDILLQVGKDVPIGMVQKFLKNNLVLTANDTDLIKVLKVTNWESNK